VELDKYVVRYVNKNGSRHDWFPILAADEANALAGVGRHGFLVVKAALLSEIKIDSITDADERDSLLALREAPPESWDPPVCA
jgi:hypothetical protein